LLWLSTLEEFELLESRAALTLDPLLFEFVTSGPNRGAGVRLYRDAFSRYALVPSPLPQPANVDLTVELFGKGYPTPVLIAPMGNIGRTHEEGELPLARAARTRAVPVMCSTYTAQPFETICQVLDDVPRWFQLYWPGNREAAATLLDRALAGDASGIAVTVDTGAIPMRPESMLRAFADQLARDPQTRERLDDAGVAARALAATSGTRPPMSESDLRWLCDTTPLPVLAKGVLSARAALSMLECGADGVIVSNHGGQVIDCGRPGLDALPDVRHAVGKEVPVLFDSGIRTGSDIVKALALGADAVLVGRPCLLGLAVGGEDGVGRVLDDLLRDLRVVLGGIGCRAVRDLDAQFVRPV
jgi:isopentenyl-diphosphate delta-isomerase